MGRIQTGWRRKNRWGEADWRRETGRKRDGGRIAKGGIQMGLRKKAGRLLEEN